MGKRGPKKRELTGIVADFAEHLKTSGYAPKSVNTVANTAKAFLNYVGTERIDQISEADARTFFDR